MLQWHPMVFSTKSTAETFPEATACHLVFFRALAQVKRSYRVRMEQIEIEISVKEFWRPWQTPHFLKSLVFLLSHSSLPELLIQPGIHQYAQQDVE